MNMQGVIPLPDLDAKVALAAKLAPMLRKNSVIALYGDLGAGKTEMVRALLRFLGVTGDVPSPTFTLVQSYELAGLWINHFDLYRLKSENELDELGWDDAVADGVVLVEWPERAGSRLPANRLDMFFTLNADGTRQVTLCLPTSTQSALTPAKFADKPILDDMRQT